MQNKIPFTVHLEPEIKDAMDKLKAERGIPIAAQIRFGCLTWLEQQAIETAERLARRAR